MPTYEYECTKCGHHLEMLQKMSDKALTECPKCKAKLRKIISGGSGMIFKGSGFYATDYKKSGSSSEPDKTSHKKDPCSCCPKADKGTCDGNKPDTKKG